MAYRVGIIGCPGSGKSTLAADISAFLRERGLPAEFVSEYTREFIAANGGISTPYEQVFMASEQESREDTLGNKRDLIVISDSPYLLNFIYAGLLSSKNSGLRKNGNGYYKLMMQLVYKQFLKALSDYDLIIFTKRPAMVYHNDGVRIHDEEQSVQIENILSGVIEMHGGPDVLCHGHFSREDRLTLSTHNIIKGYNEYKGVAL